MAHRGIALLVLLLVSTGTARAQEPPAAESIEDRLIRLERELEELKRERAAERPGEASTAPVDTRGPAAHITAKVGEGITVTAADDMFSLRMRGRIQLRYTHTDLEGDEPSDGFVIRRARLRFSGHLYTRDLTYDVQLGFSNQDTERDLRLMLRDAFGNWKIVRDLETRFGQMKVPFDRQRITSSGKLQFCDRSIVVGELNLDRDVGVYAHSTDLFGLGKRLRYAVGVMGGDGRNRIATEEGLLAMARLEVLPLGDFDGYEEADLDRRADPRLAVGAAVAYNSNTNRSRSTFEEEFPNDRRVDYRHAEVDLTFKWMGFSLLAECLRREATQEVLFLAGAPQPAVLTRSGWGYFVQAGYMITEHVEVAGRFGELFPLGASAVRHTYEAGGGINVYVHRHEIKVQTDFFHLWDVHPSDSTDEARVQVQLSF